MPAGNTPWIRPPKGGVGQKEVTVRKPQHKRAAENLANFPLNFQQSSSALGCRSRLSINVTRPRNAEQSKITPGRGVQHRNRLTLPRTKPIHQSHSHSTPETWIGNSHSRMGDIFDEQIRQHTTPTEKKAAGCAPPSRNPRVTTTHGCRPSMKGRHPCFSADPLRPCGARQRPPAARRVPEVVRPCAHGRSRPHRRCQ